MGPKPVDSTVALFSTTQRTGRWRVAGETHATALFGKVVVDLRQAEIEGEKLLVRATTLCGRIVVIVPEDAVAELTGTALFAGIKDMRASQPSEGSGPAIRVDGFALFSAIVLIDRDEPVEEEQTSID